jgi:hypothetical protein
MKFSSRARSSTRRPEPWRGANFQSGAQIRTRCQLQASVPQDLDADINQGPQCFHMQQSENMVANREMV